MKKSLSAATAVVLALISGLITMPRTARADDIVFDASGLFADGATLGGTYTVDTTTGVPISVDMTFGPPVSSDVTILDGTTTVGGHFAQFTLNNLTGPNFYPGFTFVSNVPTLVGYDGGPITGALFLDSSNPADNTGLLSGTLTATPESGSLVLLVVGMLGLAAALRFRCVRRSGLRLTL